MASPKIIDHQTRALAEATETFRQAVSFRALIDVAAGRKQEMEDLQDQMITDRTLAAAEGVNLDQYGELVGQLRADLADADYRVLLRATYAAHTSHGGVDDIVNIVAQVTGVDTIEYHQTGPATYLVQWERASHLSEDLQRRLIDLVSLATIGGVGFEGHEGVTGAFRFDSGPGFDQGKLGAVVGIRE